MKRVCNFDLEGVCYAPVCFSKVECGAKVGGKIVHASEVEIKGRSAKIYYVEAEVKQPTVVNTSSENVATE